MKVSRSNIEWWRGTATHMWRMYFSLEEERKQGKLDWNTLPLPKQKMYAICNHLFLHKFVKTDQDILKTYFTSDWGDDQYVVENYASKNHIPKNVIWIVVRRAGRLAIEEVGLLERKEGKDE